MFVHTIIRYYKFTNSNKQFCGRSNRASIAKLLTRYLNLRCNAAKKTKQDKTKLIKPNNQQISIQINNSNTINLYFKYNIMLNT